MPILELVESDIKGAVKVTCGEASILLHENKIRKAWFRPDGLLTRDPENDTAYVWMADE